MRVLAVSIKEIKQLSDEALMSRFRSTHKNYCFEQLVMRYQSKLYNIALKILGNTYDAEEVVQETFIRLFINYDKYHSNTPFAAWLFTITHNLCKDLWRLRQRSIVYENIICPALSLHEDSAKEYRKTLKQIADKMPGPAQQLENAERRISILRSLSQLPASQKRVIILRDIQGLSYKQIATLTGSAIGTVRSRLFYGREKLKTKLKD